MKKRMLMLTMIAAFAMALTIGVKAEAAAAWGITGVYSSSKTVYVQGGSYDNVPTFGLFNYKNKLVKTETGTYISFDNLKLGQAYTVRCRYGTGKWSKAKGFILMKPKSKTRYYSNGTKKVYFYIPKNLKGVKKITLKVASKNAQYSNMKAYKTFVRNIKPKKKSQTIIVSKVKKKTLKTAKTYYYYGLFPKFTNKVTCVNFFYVYN